MEFLAFRSVEKCPQVRILDGERRDSFLFGVTGNGEAYAAIWNRESGAASVSCFVNTERQLEVGGAESGINLETFLIEPSFEGWDVIWEASRTVSRYSALRSAIGLAPGSPPKVVADEKAAVIATFWVAESADPGIMLHTIVGYPGLTQGRRAQLFLDHADNAVVTLFDSKHVGRAVFLLSPTGSISGGFFDERGKPMKS